MKKRRMQMRGNSFTCPVNGVFAYISWLEGQNAHLRHGLQRCLTVERRCGQHMESLRSLIHSIPQMVWIANADGSMIEYSNQHWYEYTGVPFEHAREHDWLAVIHPEDRQTTLNAWMKSVQTGKTFEMEYRLRCSQDGTYRWFLVRAEAMKDVHGQIHYWFGIHTDIQRWKLAEESLRYNEEQLRQLADAMPQLVWVTYYPDHITYCNRQWCEYTGLSPEQTNNRGWATITHPDDVSRCIDLWMQALQQGETFETEYRLRRASDGEYRWFLGRAYPIKDERGRIIKWFGTCTDIDDIKRAGEILQQANQGQRNFIAIVSHEFRTTLTSIQGFSELLRDQQFVFTEVQEFAGDIHADAVRLHRMIDDLLDLEKMQSGKIVLAMERLNVNEVIREVAQRVDLVTRNHEFHLELDTRLPHVEGDRDKLVQVLMNLFSNAIKYSPQGGSIVVKSYRDGKMAHISVQDQGVGMPEEALDKIFLPYNRIHRDKTHHIQGTGLGLSIVRQIVEMHAGHVWAESTPGAGSTFHVALLLGQ